MKIVIDARWIFPEISGIGAYTRELIRALASSDRKNSYVLLFNDPAVRDRTLAETGIRSAPSFSAVLLPYGVFSLGNQMRLPGVLKKNEADVYHSPNYMVPLMAFPRRAAHRTKCVATIHDVIPMLFPGSAPRSKKARIFPLFRRLMVEIGIRADAIITDSNASRTDILKCLQIPPESAAKVRAVYCGVAERFRPPQSPRKQDGGETRTILYVGRFDPYKNLAVAVQAFAAVRKTCPFQVRMTVAGAPDPRYPEARLMAEQLGVNDAINWAGYLSDGDLVNTYRQAHVLIHPSRYEGFGLQVVEAMASGLPVVCSNAGAVPEVAGDAAIMLDPGDVHGFAAKVKEVLTNRQLADEMSRKGILQAAKFTWSRTAAETLAIYEELACHEQGLQSRPHRMAKGDGSSAAPLSGAARPAKGKITRIAMGWFFLIVGFAGLFLPVIQGILFMVIGALLLAPYVKFFRWLSVKVRRRHPPIRNALKEAKKRGLPVP